MNIKDDIFIGKLSYQEAVAHKQECMAQYNQCKEKNGEPLHDSTKAYLIDRVKQVDAHLVKLNEEVLEIQEQDLKQKARIVNFVQWGTIITAILFIGAMIKLCFF